MLHWLLQDASQLLCQAQTEGLSLNPITSKAPAPIPTFARLTTVVRSTTQITQRNEQKILLYAEL